MALSQAAQRVSGFASASAQQRRLGLGLWRPAAQRSAAPAAAAARGRRSMVVQAVWQPKGPDVADRVLASLPYLLPLLDVLPQGRFIFIEYPFVARSLALLGPLAGLYHAFPFAPFLIFLGVYAGIVNNQQLSRFVRYNAMQAVLLDILLIIPQLLLDQVFSPGNGGLGLQLYEGASNTVFLFVAVSVAYGMGACAVGQTPRLPLVADAAETQVR